MKTYWVYIMSNKVGSAVCGIHQETALSRIPAQKQTLSGLPRALQRKRSAICFIRDTANEMPTV
jgi:hypothetical protein